MRHLFCLALLILSPAAAFAATPLATAQSAAAAKPTPLPSVWLEDLTWQEVKAAIASGKTIVIVPTGGTEQNGPQLALGKHNFILRYTAMAIAERLGDALVAPILPYVPEGDFHPPTGHMRFAGTLSVRPETFAAVIEDTARSLKEHGFTLICFVGEHGSNQALQAYVARKLNEEWKGQGVRVLHVGDYYNENNGQDAWLLAHGEKKEDIEAHAALSDTSEMMAVFPRGVREDLRGPRTAADMESLGAGGSSEHASKAYGAKLLDLKVQAAVKEIREAEQQQKAPAAAK